VKPFYVYMLRCGDGSYYTGQTDDMDSRMQQHEAGEIGYTATRKPVELVWQGEFETREGAIAFEQQIKGWSRAKKEALMAGDWARVQELAKSKSTVHPEPVEGLAGLRQAQPERKGAQPEREGAQPERSGVRPEQHLVDRILDKDSTTQRRAIAKAITLLESTRADHRAQGDELLTALLPHTGKSFRLGISGVPGVGKSTFIEVLGLYLIEQGHRVAVLTIDPSSTVSGGSILGDKTRMEKLSVHERAYIRPSPSSGTLGGVAEKTREAMLVCEAAGYDVVIVETVGVGQSETAVAGMTDMFVLMQLPNAGDDLQAIKKGVMELADLVVINKADLDPDAATRAQAQIVSSLRLLGQHGHPDHAHHDPKIWHPQAIQLSALHGSGVDAFWTAVSSFRALQQGNGHLAARRQHQALAWMWERIDAGLKHAFRHDAQVAALLPRIIAEVAAGRLAASTAARNLLQAHGKRS
jgi:LAO/AO transport system kinase